MKHDTTRFRLDLMEAAHPDPREELQVLLKMQGEVDAGMVLSYGLAKSEYLKCIAEAIELLVEPLAQELTTYEFKLREAIQNCFIEDDDLVDEVKFAAQIWLEVEMAFFTALNNGKQER